MALKITLRPNERMIIGRSVIRNTDAKCSLVIENNVPILREKDILSEKDANSPARRIYFVIQLMYIDQEKVARHHQTYWQLVNDFIGAAPSATGFIDHISEYIYNEDYYRALKAAARLIDYEQELIAKATAATCDCI